MVLRAAQFEIIPRNLGNDAYQDVEPCCFDRGDTGVGGLDRAANAAKEIELPGGVKAGLVKFSFAKRSRSARGSDGLAQKAVRIAGVGLDGWREVEGREPPERAGFFESCGSKAQVVIVSDGAVHEPIESCVVESLPPGRER